VIAGDEGLQALTDQRLASETGLSLEELSRHSATASICLYESYDEVARSIYEDFAAAFAQPGWRSALRLASRNLLDWMAARPAEARLCFSESLRGDHELARRREANRRRLMELAAVTLARGGGLHLAKTASRSHSTVWGTPEELAACGRPYHSQQQ
jgi:hypothetical protein